MYLLAGNSEPALGGDPERRRDGMVTHNCNLVPEG